MHQASREDYCASLSFIRPPTTLLKYSSLQSIIRGIGLTFAGLVGRGSPTPRRQLPEPFMRSINNVRGEEKRSGLLPRKLSSDTLHSLSLGASD